MFIFRRHRVGIFVDINKIVTMFIKAIFKNFKKFKRSRNYVPKGNLYLYFLIEQILLVSNEKVSAELKECVT